MNKFILKLNSKIKIALLALSYASLVGCAGSSVTMFYYQLDDASDARLEQVNYEEKQLITVSRLRVPSYLKQSSIVMRTSQQQLHFSGNHLWAEVPELAIHSALLEDLNNISEQHYFINWTNSLKQNSQGSINIHIQHFYPTEDGTVLFSGSIEYLESTKSQGRISDFFIETDLNQDGYAHAIRTMRKQILMLAKQVQELATN